MRKSLSWKLTLAFMLVATITAGLVALFIRLSSADRLTQLILEQERSAMQQALVDYYSASGSWAGVGRDWSQLQFQNDALSNLTLATQSNGTTDRHPQQGNRPGNNRDPRSLFGLADARGVVLVPVDGQYPAGARLPADVLNAGAPVMVNNQQVGTILTSNQQLGFNTAESLFLDRTTQALFFAMAGALLVALALGFLLARTLTLPLRALTRASQGIARGELGQQVAVASQDELGQLAESFNRMSQEVARVNQQRRQMTADIAHDLRTPLTVIGGYVESMRDGVLAPTPARLALIYGEIERLQNLVGDLRLLSQADAGELPLNPQPIDVRSLLERAAALYQHKAGQQTVSLTVMAEPGLPAIAADEDRLMQVMDNLLGNALRYTPPGGAIQLSAARAEGKVRLAVADTGPGIAADELPHIFDRFYRADPSRHAEDGQSGLGLAIVKALVEAQGGRVWAESTPGKGTTMQVELQTSEVSKTSEV